MVPKQSPTLPKTLAQRVQFLREQRGLSPKGLAAQSDLPLEIIEDIEAGLELFLSVTTRTRLAKALRTLPAVLKEVEYDPLQQESQNNLSQSLDPQSAQFQMTQWMKRLYMDPKYPAQCPECQSDIISRIFQREDLYGHAWHELKVHCSQCLFSAQQSFALDPEDEDHASP